MRSRFLSVAAIILVSLWCVPAIGDMGSKGTRFSIGATVGTPSALNFEFEGQHRLATLGFSGMYFGDVSGAQLGLSPSFLRSARGAVRLQVMAGTSHIAYKREESKYWTYFGTEGVWRPGRMLLAAGLTWGNGSYSSPQPTVRLGYLLSWGQ